MCRKVWLKLEELFLFWATSSLLSGECCTDLAVLWLHLVVFQGSSTPTLTPSVSVGQPWDFLETHQSHHWGTLVFVVMKSYENDAYFFSRHQKERSSRLMVQTVQQRNPVAADGRMYGSYRRKLAHSSASPYVPPPSSSKLIRPAAADGAGSVRGLCPQQLL